MKPSCYSEATSIGKPESYTFLMHISTCLDVPINLFGAYCILFKTPKIMESVKSPMLLLHVLCTLQDFYLSFLTIPSVYSPWIIGCSLGFWESSVFHAFLIIVLVGTTSAAILVIFENRYYILFGKGHWWRRVRKPFLCVSFLQTPASILPFYFTIPDQEDGLKVVAKEMPCDPSPTIENPRKLVIFSTDGRFIIWVIMMITIVFTIQIMTFCIILLWKIVYETRQKSLSSRKTIELQKVFLLALLLQTIIPITALVLPVCYVVFATYFSYFNHAMNNLVFCILGSHGFLSTIIMVFVHSPYRKVTLYPIRKIFKKKDSENVRTARSIITIHHFEHRF